MKGIYMVDADRGFVQYFENLLFSNDADYKVLGHSYKANDFLNKIKERPDLLKKIDLLLVNPKLNDLNGLDLIKKVQGYRKDINVCILMNENTKTFFTNDVAEMGIENVLIYPNEDDYFLRGISSAFDSIEKRELGLNLSLPNSPKQPEKTEKEVFEYLNSENFLKDFDFDSLTAEYMSNKTNGKEKDNLNLSEVNNTNATYNEYLNNFSDKNNDNPYNNLGNEGESLDIIQNSYDVTKDEQVSEIDSFVDYKQENNYGVSENDFSVELDSDSLYNDFNSLSPFGTESSIEEDSLNDNSYYKPYPGVIESSINSKTNENYQSSGEFNKHDISNNDSNTIEEKVDHTLNGVDSGLASFSDYMQNGNFNLNEFNQGVERVDSSENDNFLGGFDGLDTNNYINQDVFDDMKNPNNDKFNQKQMNYNSNPTKNHNEPQNNGASFSGYDDFGYNSYRESNVPNYNKSNQDMFANSNNPANNNFAGGQNNYNNPYNIKNNNTNFNENANFGHSTYNKNSQSNNNFGNGQGNYNGTYDVSKNNENLYGSYDKMGYNQYNEAPQNNENPYGGYDKFGYNPYGSNNTEAPQDVFANVNTPSNNGFNNGQNNMYEAPQNNENPYGSYDKFGYNAYGSNNTEASQDVFADMGSSPNSDFGGNYNSEYNPSQNNAFSQDVFDGYGKKDDLSKENGPYGDYSLNSNLGKRDNFDVHGQGVRHSADNRSMIQDIYNNAGASNLSYTPSANTEQQANQSQGTYEKGASVVGIPDFAKQVVAFYSTKGGIGKTTVAINSTIELAKFSKKRVCLIDFDLTNANVDTHLGILDAKYNLSVISNFDSEIDSFTIKKIVTEHRVKDKNGDTVAFDVIVGFKEMRMSQRFDEKEVHKILTILEDMYDIVVVDMHPVYTDPAVSTILKKATKIIFVTEQEMTALNGAKDFILACKKYGIPSEKLYLVLNRYTNKTAIVTKNRIEKSLGKKIYATIPSNMDRLREAVNTNQPVTITDPDSDLARAYIDVARVIDKNIVVPENNTSFFSSLFKK